MIFEVQPYPLFLGSYQMLVIHGLRSLLPSINRSLAMPSSNISSGYYRYHRRQHSMFRTMLGLCAILHACTQVFYDKHFRHSMRFAATPNCHGNINHRYILACHSPVARVIHARGVHSLSYNNQPPSWLNFYLACHGQAQSSRWEESSWGISSRPVHCPAIRVYIISHNNQPEGTKVSFSIAIHILSPSLFVLVTSNKRMACLFILAEQVMREQVMRQCATIRLWRREVWLCST
jgi:hypothetical protein